MNAPDLETLRIEVSGDVATATLCRPERLNAVAPQMLTDLVILADWLRERDEIHFLILDHEGPVFSAGAHLGEVRAILADQARVRVRLRANQRAAQEALAKLAAIEQISFAALRGSAYGAGVAIAMACDFRVMADDAVLNLPETRLGMFLTYAATPTLVSVVGLARAKEMILFAEDWSAQACLTAGAVQHVVRIDQVRSKIADLLGSLRERSWPALRVAKQVVNAAAPSGFGQPGVTEVELAAEALASGEVAERLDTFLKSRSRDK